MLVLYDSDIEAFLKTSITGIVGKDIIEHARRKTSVVRNAGKNMLYQARQKYDSKGLEKHLKLRKFVAGIRSGRLGYLLLVLAALCTLTVPLMFQSTYIPQEDWELERAMAIQFHQGRYLPCIVLFDLVMNVDLLYFKVSFLTSMSFQMSCAWRT